MHDRFDVKYTQINVLFVEGWSIAGLRKVVWPSRATGDQATLSAQPIAFRAKIFYNPHDTEDTEDTLLTQRVQR